MLFTIHTTDGFSAITPILDIENGRSKSASVGGDFNEPYSDRYQGVVIMDR